MVITNPKVLAELRAMARSYGVACVVTALYEMASKAAATEFANNPDAVIHRDVVTLKQTIEDLKLNHPLRMLETTS